MRRSRSKPQWWGLYALAPLMIAAIVLDEEVLLSDTLRMILLGLIAVATCVLALRWVGRHYALLAQEDADKLCPSTPEPAGMLEQN